MIWWLSLGSVEEDEIECLEQCSSLLLPVDITSTISKAKSLLFTGNSDIWNPIIASGKLKLKPVTLLFYQRYRIKISWRRGLKKSKEHVLEAPLVDFSKFLYRYYNNFFACLLRNKRVCKSLHKFGQVTFLLFESVFCMTRTGILYLIFDHKTEYVGFRCKFPKILFQQTFKSMKFTFCHFPMTQCLTLTYISCT